MQTRPQHGEVGRCAVTRVIISGLDHEVFEQAYCRLHLASLGAERRKFASGCRLFGRDQDHRVKNFLGAPHIAALDGPQFDVVLEANEHRAVANRRAMRGLELGVLADQ